MELRHLRYFVAVAEELNMRLAAEKLHISQPPLSRQIRDLENDLGTRLFDRTKQKLKLTRSGEFLLKEAKEILFRSQRAAQLVKTVNNGGPQSLVIAYRVPVEEILPARVIRKCREIYPSMEIVIREMTLHEQIAALLENQIDLGYLGFKNLELRDILNFETIYKSEMLVALPAGHKLARKRKIALEELADQPFVFVRRSESPIAYDWLLSIPKACGFSPNIVKQADTARNLIKLVASGFGISLLPDVVMCYAAPEVVFRPLKDRIQVDWSIAWRKDNDSPALKVFLDLLREDRKRNRQGRGI